MAHSRAPGRAPRAQRTRPSRSARSNASACTKMRSASVHAVSASNEAWCTETAASRTRARTPSSSASLTVSAARNAQRASSQRDGASSTPMQEANPAIAAANKRWPAPQPTSAKLGSARGFHPHPRTAWAAKPRKSVMGSSPYRRDAGRWPSAPKSRRPSATSSSTPRPRSWTVRSGNSSFRTLSTSLAVTGSGKTPCVEDAMQEEVRRSCRHGRQKPHLAAPRTEPTRPLRPLLPRRRPALCWPAPA